MTKKVTKKAKKRDSRPEKPADDSDSIGVLIDALGDATDTEIYHNSYVSRSTIKRLRDRVTKRPQFMTMRGIAQARGYEYVLRKKKP